MTTRTRLPYGLGSISRRGNIYWLLYRDAKGERVQETSHSTDPALALYLLGVRALANLEARQIEVSKIVKEAAKHITGEAIVRTQYDGSRSRESSRHNRKYKGGRRPVPAHGESNRKGTE